MRADVLIGGKYRLVRELGAGGMGVVWLARNELVDRDFAIKFLHPAAATSEAVLARFFQEAKILGRLRHPSLLEIMDVGRATELDGAPYLVMELLEGISLDGAIRAMGRLEVPLALLILQEIARALSLAHDKGIVHRDLKPANIFLHRPGNGALVPKVLDFGISKIVGGQGSEPVFALTQTGAILGSPMYMSPEQAGSDKTIDARSDVHALGVMLWECLVGKPPFVAETYNTLVVEIMTGTRPFLRDVLPEAPASVDALVTKAFARQREERFASAAEFAAAIGRELTALGEVRTLDLRTTAEFFFAELPTAHPPLSQRKAFESSTTAAVVSPKSPLSTDPTQLDSRPASEVLGRSPVASTGHVPSFAARSQDPVSEPLAPPPARRRRAVAFVIAAGVVAILADGGWYLAGKRAAETPKAPDVPAVSVAALPLPASVEVSAKPLPQLAPLADPIVVDAGTKHPSRPPPTARPSSAASAKPDWRRGVSGDGF